MMKNWIKAILIAIGIFALFVTIIALAIRFNFLVYVPLAIIVGVFLVFLVFATKLTLDEWDSERRRR